MPGNHQYIKVTTRHIKCGYCGSWWMMDEDFAADKPKLFCPVCTTPEVVEEMPPEDITKSLDILKSIAL